MTVLWLLLVILVIASVLVVKGMIQGDLLSVLMGSSLFLLFALFLGLVDFDQPTAIDVYRGKTTLKVTYVDSIAVDSVVVFKDKN